MFSRRRWMNLALTAPGLGAIFRPDLRSQQASSSKVSKMNLPSHYPAYEPDLIREIVTVSHFDLKKLEDLIGSRPHLANAALDWGFGDWETPLGAASHMGRRDIAEYLYSLGVAPTLFSAVLFGDLPMVKAILTSNPGLAAKTGPHSISLLAHARMAGVSGHSVLAYLISRGDADLTEPKPLSEAERTVICGLYRFGEEPSQTVTISDDMQAYEHTPMYTHAPQLNFTKAGAISRALFYTPEQNFYPVGAPAVRVSFQDGDGSMQMKIVDQQTILIAFRSSPHQ